jgi:phosphoenolpyruvate synthase/pyruvate phosphate dikinase
MDIEVGGNTADHMPIRWLGSAECKDPSEVGNKASTLSRLSRCFKVPPAFCIASQSIAELSSTDSQPSPSICEAIAAAYERLCEGEGVPCRVAIRSSAFDEDSPLASFAGQYDSFLNVVGFNNILSGVLNCSRAAVSARVNEYRRRFIADQELRFAVLVQLFINADVSGIGVSHNPTEATDQILINSNWGQCDGVTGGACSPDSYGLERSGLSLASVKVATKLEMSIATEGGTRLVNVPSMIRNESSLSENQIKEVGSLLLAVEREVGYPVEIEFAYEGTELYLLQCRPC